MAKPCDASGRVLQLGDRRWAKSAAGVHELMYLDTVDEVMRFLALPLDHLKGETATIVEHELKIVKAKVADGRSLYAVGSKANPLQDVLSKQGAPQPLPADVGLQDLEQFVQEKPASTASEYFSLSPGPPGGETEEMNVITMAMLLDIKDMLHKFGAHLEAVERERKMPTMRDPPPGLVRGARF